MPSFRIANLGYSASNLTAFDYPFGGSCRTLDDLHQAPPRAVCPGWKHFMRADEESIRIGLMSRLQLSDSLSVNSQPTTLKLVIGFDEPKQSHPNL